MASIFFLSGADLEQGKSAAERSRLAVSKAPAEIETGSVAISASFGVSVVLPEWRGERDSLFLQKMIVMADGAMYQAKQSGRNQVCVAPIQHPTMVDEKDLELMKQQEKEAS